MSDKRMTETETAEWVPVSRTTKKIVHADRGVMAFGNDRWELNFYRNNAYECGLTGHYTFLVVEPRNTPGKNAPLWVYLHGGAVGYYDGIGIYHAMDGQNENTWNHESSFDVLRCINPNHGIFNENGSLRDNTVVRRLKEGYRVLVVSYSDHDLYSGCGTPYYGNPRGGKVHGLQACMAAVEYTVANYPTTHVFTHGTSAGSFGAYALGFAFAQEGIHLSGLVMDSGSSTPRLMTIVEALAGEEGFPQPKDFDSKGVIKKVGAMVNPDLPFHPEAAIRDGFRVPMLIVAGREDPFYGGGFPPVPEAKNAGLDNHYWMMDGIRQAIEEQDDSPHQLLKLDDWGHVPTNRDECPVHDMVDAFIQRVTANAPHPFGKC